MIKPLGTKDKALFETARQLLISEIVFAKDIVDSEARALLDEAMEDMIF
jgi:RNA polymerase-interacting CarD/CdnL/TRCF family regulator